MEPVMNEPPVAADHFLGATHTELRIDIASRPVAIAPEAEPVGVPIMDQIAARIVAVQPETWISLAVVGAAMAWVFTVLHPGLIFTNTLPTGGDMGAHVWAPAYLRDHLLPKGRLIGWTPDWYAGFPAFQYYMILPSLAVVVLNVGLVWWQAVLVIASVFGFAGWVFARPSLVRWRTLALAVTIAATLLSIGIPYGIAFKLIVISGLVTMPLNGWALGRLAGLAFPGPLILAVATLPYVFDRSYNIYGGNIASTMAGEFAFSMSLSLSLLAIGCSIRALDTGKGRGWAALTLALTGLCHLFPAFFALGVVLLYAAFRFGKTQLHTLAAVLPVGGALGAFWALPFFAKSTYLNDMGWGRTFQFKENLLTRNTLPADFLRDSPPLEVVFAIAVVGFVLSLWRRNRLGIALGAAAVGIALAFIHKPEGRMWNARMLPFYYLCLYLLAAIALAEAVQLVRERRWARHFAASSLLGLVVVELTRALAAHSSFETRVGRVLPGNRASVLGAFLIGLLAGILWLRRGFGVFALALVCGLIWMAHIAVPNVWWTTAHGAHGFFAVAGESVLRPATSAVLQALAFPAAYLLFGMIIFGIVDLVGDVTFVADDRSGRGVQLLAAPIAFLGIFAVLGPALHSIPGGHTRKDGAYEWGVPGWMHHTRDASFLPGWASWNFSGYERKAASGSSGGYPEFYGLVHMVDGIGHDPQYGCGRSMWEYGPRLEGYGTPMAPMLLPLFTDGCIGSMEGLYFEASSTTPFHFLNQSALSKQPSSPQRDLPYPGFDIDLGVKQLQLMGVRYYLAFSDSAVAAASAHPDLTEIASAGVWHMYLVAQSDLVTPLHYEPVVYSDVGQTQAEWLQPAAKFFDDPTQWDVLRAATGPKEWARYAIPQTAKLNASKVAKGRAAATAAGKTYEDPAIPDAPRKELPAATVTNTHTDDESISFDVDQIGVPVLVKASYFPNWKVTGAKGPYRVTPNLMVVIPTSTHVRLHYGYVGIDVVSMALTVLGIVGLIVLFRRRVGPAARPWFDPLDAVGSLFTSTRPDAPGDLDAPPPGGQWWLPAEGPPSAAAPPAGPSSVPMPPPPGPPSPPGPPDTKS